MNLARHPLSALFSAYDLSGDALKDLATDIRDNGQHHPIIIHDGAILDGFNRYQACEVFGIEPQFVLNGRHKFTLPAFTVWERRTRIVRAGLVLQGFRCLFQLRSRDFGLAGGPAPGGLVTQEQPRIKPANPNLYRFRGF